MLFVKAAAQPPSARVTGTKYKASDSKYCQRLEIVFIELEDRLMASILQSICGGVTFVRSRSLLPLLYNGGIRPLADRAKFSPHVDQRHSDLTPEYRSYLFVPGDSERKIQKSVECGADLCILDLDDGVGYDRKSAARDTISRLLPVLTYPGTTNTMIRLNASTLLTSKGESLLDQDVSMLGSLQVLPDSVGLSKVDTPEDVATCMEQLDKTLPRDMSPLGIFLMIESPQAITALEDICVALVKTAQAGRFLPAGLVFGHMDYCTNLGINPTVQDRSRFLYAEQKLVTVAKAFRLQAVDCVYTAVKDLDGLRQDCKHGAGTGFTGKTVIHPSHVQTVNELFSPPPEHVEWARGLLDAYANHQSAGEAVFVYQGQLVDEPVFRRARFTLAAADKRGNM